MKNLPTEDNLRAFLRGLTDGARTDLIPKMQASMFCMLVFVDGYANDVTLALQLGVALLLDKPLIIVAIGNAPVPLRLRQIAEAVVEGDAFDGDLKEKLEIVIRDLFRRRGIFQ